MPENILRSLGLSLLVKMTLSLSSEPQARSLTDRDITQERNESNAPVGEENE